MPIDSKHPDYEKMLARWQRCRDVVDGGDAVKQRGETYLKRLSEQTDDEYKAYVHRAYWFGATARTIQGLAGAIMRRDPTIDNLPEGMAGFEQNVTKTGQSFSAFAKTALEEVVKTGRYGILVDMPTTPSPQAEPYWVGYTAEQIVNWQVDMKTGVPVLVFVMLCEHVAEEDPDDLYKINTVEQYRELYMDDGKYRQQLWRKNKQGEWEPFGEEIAPTFRESALTFIPFLFLNATTITPMIEKPPLLDLVDANLSHYRSSADLEHGRHYTALPTPWVAGFPENTKLKIGSSIAWIATDVNARAGMLEFTGQGLGALERALEGKAKDMAVLGARLLEVQKASVEAADTLQSRMAGEQSFLMSLASTLNVGFNVLWRWTALWMSIMEAQANKIAVAFNTDFVETRMSFLELTELVKNWQSGAISYETMYYNMQRGEITRPGVTWKKEKAQIENERPVVIPQDIDPDTGLPMNGVPPQLVGF